MNLLDVAGDWYVEPARFFSITLLLSPFVSPWLTLSCVGARVLGDRSGGASHGTGTVMSQGVACWGGGMLQILPGSLLPTGAFQQSPTRMFTNWILTGVGGPLLAGGPVVQLLGPPYGLGAPPLPCTSGWGVCAFPLA